MQRREFIRTSVMGLIAVSVSSYVTPDEDTCETTNDILGPFYRTGAPLRKDLSYDGQKAEKLIVQGKVYSDDCKTLLKDALVEIWYADTDGEYDNDTPKYLNRGSQQSNSEGGYSFIAAIPGHYLNGTQYRPSHIHFKVTAAGHKNLVSQIYFKKDPYLSIDPWASKPTAEQRILPMSENADKIKQVQFDIYLKKA